MLYRVYTFCRVLVEHMPEFAGQSPLVEWHIKSEYSHEMAKKSIVVCAF